MHRLLHGAINHTVEEEDDEDYRQIHARIKIREGEAAADMLYARSKVRILRASVLNAILITAATAVYLASLNKRWWLAAPIGVIIWLIVLGAYIHTQRLYRSRLERFNKYLSIDQFLA